MLVKEMVIKMVIVVVHGYCCGDKKVVSGVALVCAQFFKSTSTIKILVVKMIHGRSSFGSVAGNAW